MTLLSTVWRWISRKTSVPISFIYLISLKFDKCLFWRFFTGFLKDLLELVSWISLILNHYIMDSINYCYFLRFFCEFFGSVEFFQSSWITPVFKNSFEDLGLLEILLSFFHFFQFIISLKILWCNCLILSRSSDSQRFFWVSSDSSGVLSGYTFRFPIILMSLESDGLKNSYGFSEVHIGSSDYQRLIGKFSSSFSFVLPIHNEMKKNLHESCSNISNYLLINWQFKYLLLDQTI